jgi:ATP-dependent DNA helicase RecG
MKNNFSISMRELSTIFNVDIKTIKRDIAKLKTQNKIKRIGPDKGGYWEIIE